MKTRIKIVLVMLGIAFFSTTSYATHQNRENNPATLEMNTQDTTITGTYKGHDDSGYNFTTLDENGIETIMMFSNVDSALATANDLDSESTIGTTYSITFILNDDGTKTITDNSVKALYFLFLTRVLTITATKHSLAVATRGHRAGLCYKYVNLLRRLWYLMLLQFLLSL